MCCFSCGNFIITAQRDRILIHHYLKDTSTCAERQSISIAGNEFCCDILRVMLSDDEKMLSKIYFATATNDEILLNTFDCSTGDFFSIKLQLNQLKSQNVSIFMSQL